MSLYKISQESIQEWVSQLISEQTVYGPVRYRDKFVYNRLHDGSELRLDFDVTVQPPKRYFLPVRETLLYCNDQQEYESVVDSTPFVLFGVHPYDVAAISQLDELFQVDHYDIHYMQRRNKATIVACDVFFPSKNVFAACMGTATVDEGFDILLTYVGGNYVVDVRSAKGEQLARKITAPQRADKYLLERREQAWEDLQRFLCRHALHCKPEELPELLDRSYQHPVWEEQAKKCYSCGSCTMVCPTCYCFDVQDDPDWDLKGARRERIWDSCQLEDFAIVAGNHNFRGTRKERFRHRYYRKGKYLWDRMGQIACVGCGRCITACTANIANPVQIFNTLLEDSR